MIYWQKLEGAVLFLASLFALSQIGFALPLWGAALAFFAPDLSFLAYKFGPEIGAAAYNAVHFYGFGIAIALIGWATPTPSCSPLACSGWPMRALTARLAMG